ncbi:MAG: hypothetical protein PW792_16970 [Acidobacteriaceae bacterium]|nr:hypothetical protein [Acidobacteriaceae bacterium]
MVTPTDLSIWLNQQAWPIAIIAAIVLFTYVALKLSSRKRIQTLAKQREGVTDHTFAEFLAQYGFDQTLSASTFRYLQQVQNVGFPILPTDMLDEDLGLGHDDVEQTVRDLTEALGRERHPGLLQTPLTTVEDLIRLLQASPRAVKGKASAA